MACVAARVDSFTMAMTHGARLREARGRATSEEVARVLFEASTDGTEQLRYLATKDIAPLVEARRQTSEQSYIEMMRRQFMRRG